jgi:hypothetical protein
MKITISSCLESRVYHHWVDRISERSPGRALNVLLIADPALRVCKFCFARARIDSQGRTIWIEQGCRTVNADDQARSARVRVAPMNQRASWARKKTEFDS